jgi:hypothetical protein
MRLQALSDSLTAEKIEALLRKWLDLLPHPWGDPPALPGRQQKFDRSGSVLHHPCACEVPCGPLSHEVLVPASDRLRSGPFEGPATVKPPALPGDVYYVVG